MICAIDCDLRTSYCVTDDGQSARAPDPAQALQAVNLPLGSTILFEVASPVSFVRGHGSNAAMYQLAKWAIWNAAWAARLAEDYEPNFFVAPSNVWTKGHSEKVRHLIAQCAMSKKDLRECEAMLFFYKQEPQLWQTLSSYLQSLSTVR